MISKTFRIARMIVLASFALSSPCPGSDLFKRLSEWHLRVFARRHRCARHPCRRLDPGHVDPTTGTYPERSQKTQTA